MLLRNDNHLDEGTIFSTKAYYQGGKYLEEKSNIIAPSAEYYASLGFSLNKNNFTYIAGYSQNKAESTRDYNLRLTPYGNSDKRDFQQTLSWLEDFNVAGAKVVKIGIKCNMAGLGIPDLTLGTSANYGWHVVSDISKTKDQRTYDGKMQALDFLIIYKIDIGDLKSINITVLPAIFRSNNTNAKQGRNDIRVIFAHSLNLF